MNTTNIRLNTPANVVALLRAVRDRCRREGVQVPAVGQTSRPLYSIRRSPWR
jgi:hypothetical protein